ncbi:hypothetical protein LP420_29970 [Massilia sp. B-10]|nr:hypothetical protein LP420_29970 [Massilia sp. B-10]
MSVNYFLYNCIHDNNSNSGNTMKFVKVLLLVGMLVAASLVRAADEPVAHLKAVTELMAAMQTEKMMRTITGTSGFASEENARSPLPSWPRCPRPKFTSAWDASRAAI